MAELSPHKSCICEPKPQTPNPKPKTLNLRHGAGVVGKEHEVVEVVPFCHHRLPWLVASSFG